jgi:hypothetical protein
MAYFQTENPNLGKFRRALDWKKVYIFYWPFEILYEDLEYFMTILYSFGTFFRFGYHVPRKTWQPWVLQQKVISRHLNESVSIKEFFK